MKAALIPALLLAGCASVPAPPVTVRVPVPVPCLDAPLAPPRYTPYAELLRMSPGDFVVAITADRADLIAWTDEAQAVMAACVKR